MKNLDELKLVIPDWRDLNFHENNILKRPFSEIESKRFVARLVLMQIAEYLEVEFEYLAPKSRPALNEWLQSKHPKILEDYFK